VQHYTKILVWENNRRLSKLLEFRNLVVDYFHNSHPEWMADSRIEERAARVARVKINRVMGETHDIILHSGIDPTLVWTPPPARGGYVMNVDLIQNIFNLCQFRIGPEGALDFVDRAIGVYESNHRSSLIRTFNPLFYVGLVFDAISELPFIAIGRLGFDRQKVESSAIGRLIKGALYLITVIAALLTILQLLDFLEPVRQFMHQLLDSNNASQSSTIN